MGTLYYGDNLDILRRYLADESVDLVYLDPPFNSAQNYNAFFEEKDGTAAAAQIQAFKDTWQWNNESRDAYDALSLSADKLGNVMRASISNSASLATASSKLWYNALKSSGCSKFCQSSCVASTLPGSSP